MMMMLMVEQVVQEYERAVIFRLGRLRPGGAKGPGDRNIFRTRISKIKESDLVPTVTGWSNWVGHIHIMCPGIVAIMIVIMVIIFKESSL